MRLLRGGCIATAALLAITQWRFAPWIDEERAQPPAVPAAAALFDAQLRMIAALAEERAQDPGPAAMVVSTLACDWNCFRNDLLPWLQWHTSIGVRRFFIAWDGGEEDVVKLLRSLPHVQVIYLAPHPKATARRNSRWESFRAAHWQWGAQPGNFQLMVKQGFAVNEAIRASMQQKYPAADWLLHLDVDEAVLPQSSGAPRIEMMLAAAPHNATAIRLLNWEGVPPTARVQRRLSEVTLFKVHESSLDNRLADVFADELHAAFHVSSPSAFLLYGNGKAAARLNTPYLRQWGPHYFKGGELPPSSVEALRLMSIALAEGRNGTGRRLAQSDTGTWLEVESDAAVLLHYPYARRDEMRAKALRSCPLPEAAAAAARGNRTAVEKCFVLGFDADVYMAAHAGQHSETELDRLFDERIRPPADALRRLRRVGLLREERAVAATLAAHESLIQLHCVAGTWPFVPAADADDPALDARLSYLRFHE
jgi:hypothetical protein